MEIPSAEALSGQEFKRLLDFANRLSLLDLCVLMQRAFRPSTGDQWSRPVDFYRVCHLAHTGELTPEGSPPLEEAARMPSELLRELESSRRLAEAGMLQDNGPERVQLSPEGAKLVAVILQVMDLQPAYRL